MLRVLVSAREWARRNARPVVVVMALVLVAVFCVFAYAVNAIVDGSPFHLASQAAGSDARFREILGAGDWNSLSEGQVYGSLALDTVFAVVYGFGLWCFLWTWWCPPFWRVGRALRFRKLVLLLPILAATFDVLENIATGFGLDWTATGLHFRSDGWALAVSTLSCLKWFALGGAVIAAGANLVAVLLPRADVIATPLEPQRATDRPDPALGVCCSGGGIRAAAFAAGTLSSLEERGVLAEADLISAVSGGAYVVGAYASLAQNGGDTPARDVARYLEGTDPTSTASGGVARLSNHRFLQNDPGGFVRAVFLALGCVLFNVVVIAATTIAVAWPVGRLLASEFVDPSLSTLNDEAVQWSEVFEVPARLWLPAALVLALAVVVLLSSAFFRKSSAKITRLGLGIAAAGVLLAGLVFVPWALAGAQWLANQAQRGQLATVAVAGITIGTIAGTVFRIAAKPLAKIAPRLGGVLLVLVLLLFGDLVAMDAATQAGTFSSIWLWAGITVALALVFAFVDIQWFAMHRMYRTKLRGSFALARSGDELGPVDGEYAKWVDDDIRNARPELLICATAQRIGLSGNGIAAESFTISAREVSIGDTVVPTEDYLAALPPSLADEFTISSWQAITGAAFSSAMGRFGFGSTNALLAALNIDLGAWLPNPRLVTRGYRDFPRVRLPYMAKEILGVYDDYEEYVFVADGGQWENLGLVELLRRRCQTIICVDASGDTVGSFRTLLQAIDLAGTELGGKAHIDVDLRDLRALPEALPKTAIASWPIVYADRAEPGRLIYAKAQVSADADLELQRFAKTDRKFPNYSTARQNLKDGQFRALVSMGAQTGKRLADLYEETRAGRARRALERLAGARRRLRPRRAQRRRRRAHAVVLLRPARAHRRTRRRVARRHGAVPVGTRRTRPR